MKAVVASRTLSVLRNLKDCGYLVFDKERMCLSMRGLGEEAIVKILIPFMYRPYNEARKIPASLAGRQSYLETASDLSKGRIEKMTI